MTGTIFRLNNCVCSQTKKKNRLQLHRQVTQRIGRRRNSQVNTRYQDLLKKW